MAGKGIRLYGRWGAWPGSPGESEEGFGGWGLKAVGSHGRSALKAAVLGSVAFGVISKESTMPVLVVRK